jgi:hypothetical protein
MDNDAKPGTNSDRSLTSLHLAERSVSELQTVQDMVIESWLASVPVTHRILLRSATTDYA